MIESFFIEALTPDGVIFIKKLESKDIAQIKISRYKEEPLTLQFTLENERLKRTVKEADVHSFFKHFLGMFRVKKDIDYKVWVKNYDD